MPTLQIETQVSSEDLLKAVAQLSSSELEQFMSLALVLRARRKAPSLPRSESELLLKINRGLPVNVQQRFDALIIKREAEILSAEEHNELLSLTQEVEALQVERLKYLSELAQLRKTSLSKLMDELQIATPKNV